MIHRLALLFCLVLPFVGNVTLRGQELDASVIVDMQMLQLDQRVDVQTMANDVKQYLNNQRYSNKDWEGPRIPVSITIYLNSRNGDQYSGKLAIVSKRIINGDSTRGTALLRVFDQEWNFDYSIGRSLTFQINRYDPFTSVIDFYMLTAIGMDMDTYEDLGGARMYDLAKQIAGLGNAASISQFSSNYQPGEITRMSLITELTDIKFQGMRRLLYDYHYAIDEYSTNNTSGRELLEMTIKNLAQYKQKTITNKSVLLQKFFDAKSQEIADIFKGMKSSPIWDDLRYLDAGNTQLYEAARGG